MGRIKLDGPESKRIREALLSAYDPFSLQPLVRQAAPEIVNSIQWLHPGGLDMIAFDVIERANQHGVLDRLLSAMVAGRPHRPDLRALVLHLAQREGWSVPAETHGIDLSGGGLEQLTSSGDPFLDTTRLATWLIGVERQVCQVRCGQHEHGSGFLVGPDLVLTCYHVVKSHLKGGVEADDVRVRFDYRRDAQGATPAYDSLPWVAIDPSFDIPSSPFSQADITLVGEPTAEELDYALLKLAAKVGDEQIGEGKRGWVDLDRKIALPPAQAPVLIVQHPGSDSPPPPQRPLQITFATPGYLGLNENGTRVRYKPSTKPGSSGSPVFGPDLTPIALHHNRGQIDPAAANLVTENRGIPLSRIREALLAAGIKLAAP